MGFFDKKEDVLEIQLTPFGRKQMAEGKLKPAYYSFHDIGVLYDGLYGGITEEQSDIEPRIKNTPTMKVQSSFTGVETNFANQQQRSRDRNDIFSCPLGTSDPHSPYAPALNIHLLDNKISGSVNFLTGSISQIPIPQLDVDIEFRTQIKLIDAEENDEPGEQPEGHDFEGEFDASSMLDFRTRAFSDNSYVKIDGQQLVLLVEEFNVPFRKENFDIECFLVETDTSVSGTFENYIPLSFSPFSPEDEIIDVDNDSFVEYFLDITVDEEIDEREMCKLVKKDKRKGVFLREIFDCPEINEDVVSIDDVYRKNDGQGEGDIC